MKNKIIQQPKFCPYCGKEKIIFVEYTGGNRRPIWECKECGKDFLVFK